MNETLSGVLVAEQMVVSDDGDIVGKLSGILWSESSGSPQWLTLENGDSSVIFVPLLGAYVENGAIVVSYDKMLVHQSPRLRVDRAFGRDDAEDICRHYDVQDQGGFVELIFVPILAGPGRSVRHDERLPGYGVSRALATQRHDRIDHSSITGEALVAGG